MSWIASQVLSENDIFTFNILKSELMLMCVLWVGEYHCNFNFFIKVKNTVIISIKVENKIAIFKFVTYFYFAIDVNLSIWIGKYHCFFIFL